MLVFVDMGKLDDPEKNFSGQGTKTLSSNDAQTRNRTGATLVEGVSSHRCANPV